MSNELENQPEKRRPLGPWYKRAGRSLGRGTRAVGKGIYETGAGFVEGVGPIPRPTARGVGRVVGKGTKEAFKAVSRIELREPSYFWGGKTTGTYSPSRLPVEVQHNIVKELSEMYPDIYKALYEPGIRMSSFVGKLHALHPEVYEDLKAITYAQLAPGGMQQQPYGYYPTQYPQPYQYPPGGYGPPGGYRPLTR